MYSASGHLATLQDMYSGHYKYIYNQCTCRYMYISMMCMGSDPPKLCVDTQLLRMLSAVRTVVQSSIPVQ